MTVTEVEVGAVTATGATAVEVGDRLRGITTPDALAGVAAAVGLGETPAAVTAVIARWEAARTALAEGMAAYGAAVVEAAATIAETDWSQSQRYAAGTHDGPPTGAW